MFEFNSAIMFFYVYKLCVNVRKHSDSAVSVWERWPDDKLAVYDQSHQLHGGLLEKYFVRPLTSHNIITVLQRDMVISVKLSIFHQSTSVVSNL